MVLTAVGGAVGGPIGAAVGTLVGQYLDREVIFRPGRREGARLSDLRVQASSYGVAIPQLFGTMRVAGSVVWATDLLERRADTRAGKGSPTVTQYSYAASFAVLLSARPILGVGRVWADGKLLRGAAGDMKAAGAMRVHPGGEDQLPDPLIASAEGVQAPAHRGHAYAVFEELALADFGNRIPSLTFEVIADAGPVSVGAIARMLAPDVAGEAELLLDGYAAEGDAGAAVAGLAAAAGGWVAADGGALRLNDGGGPATATIPDDGVAVEGGRPGRGRGVAAAGDVARVVSVGHFDPARDWQAGSQRAVRAGPGRREQRVALPAALSPAGAKAVAATLLARAEAARTRRTVSAGLAGWALRPGQVVAVASEQGRWLVERVAIERMAATATLVPVAPGRLPAAAAAGGRAVTAADLVAGRTILHAVELPPVGDAALAGPRITVVAAGSGAGWRGAVLLLSLDGGASWEAAGRTAAPGTIGTLVSPPGPAPAGLVDRRHTIEVVLAHEGMVLADADAATLDTGGNLALVGDELIQFGRAVPLGGGRWRLADLWRGRRGTEAAIGGQAAGDRFVMIEATAVRTIDLPPGLTGTTVRIMAGGVGDDDRGETPPVAACAVTGRSVAPPSPVALGASAIEGGVMLSWTRRSRVGWPWLDGGDAALAEEREAYRVTVRADDGEVREVTVADPALVLLATWRAGRGLTVTVRQQGTLAESAPATLVIPAIS